MIRCLIMPHRGTSVGCSPGSAQVTRMEAFNGVCEMNMVTYGGPELNTAHQGLSGASSPHVGLYHSGCVCSCDIQGSAAGHTWLPHASNVRLQQEDIKFRLILIDRDIRSNLGRRAAPWDSSDLQGGVTCSEQGTQQGWELTCHLWEVVVRTW